MSNGLVLIVPKDSKLAIKGVKDLAETKIARIAMGNPETVPAGRYAQEVLTKAGLWEALKPKLIYAENVRQALDYVSEAKWMPVSSSRRMRPWQKTRCRSPLWLKGTSRSVTLWR